ncbi:MAG TPA: oligosaccharide flippase family protein, partial [Gemmatimonadales bacterium]|nr:oligosaccharide flippase family protein [Gemmatimonadales bacterium]
MTSDPAQPAGAAGAPSPAPSRTQLDRSLVDGLAWTGAFRWGAQLVSWGATVLVARLLTPADYGLVGIAMLYLGLAQLVSEFGIGAAIVQQRGLNSRQISGLGTVSILLGLGLWGLSGLVGFPLAWFFREPQVRWIVAVSGVRFLTGGIRVVPRSLLLRDLRFRQLAALDASEPLTGAPITLLLASLGWGYKSLVLGPVCGSIVSCICTVLARRHPLRWPRREDQIGKAVTFGSHIVGSRIAFYLYGNADFAVVGRVLGKAALGSYEWGWTMASVPVARISNLLSQVAPAVFSAVQDNLPELRRYILRLTEGLALFAFPMSVGLSLVAS